MVNWLIKLFYKFMGWHIHEWDKWIDFYAAEAFHFLENNPTKNATVSSQERKCKICGYVERRRLW